MKIEPLGTPMHFEALKPGEFFATLGKDKTVVFGLALPSLDQQGSFALYFGLNEISGAWKNMTVWHVADATLRPAKIATSLRTDERSTPGDLVFTGAGAYLVATHKGAVVRIDVATGALAREGADPCVSFGAWELVVQRPAVQDFEVLISHPAA